MTVMCAEQHVIKMKNYKVIFFGYIAIVLLINTICVTGKDCKYDTYDLSKLSHGSPWKAVNIVNANSWIEYEFNLCGAASQNSKCSNAAVCQTNHTGKEEVLSIGNHDSVTVKPVEQKQELWLTFMGETCGTNDTYKSIIYLKCGSSLGSPVFLDSYACDSYFEWYTDSLCKDADTSTQVKCYVFDNDKQKRSLIPLIGMHSVENDEQTINIHFGVCKSLEQKEAGYPNGTGAIDVKSRTPLGKVNPTTGLYFDDNKNLVLKYEGGSDKNCTTTITFVCPERGGSKHPELISSSQCQYMIEWQTEYACPEEQLVSKSCKLTSDIHGIEVDLTPLKKVYSVASTNSDASVKYNYTMNLCGPLLNVPCPGTNMAGISVCQQNLNEPTKSQVLGKIGQQRLSYIDQVLSLRYRGGAPCSHNHKQRETVIQFKCGVDEVGELEFYSEEECTYMFNLETTYACINPMKCTVVVSDGDKENRYDISILNRKSTDEGNWEALKPDPEKDKNTYWLNVCGPVLQKGGSANCPNGSSVCMKDVDGNYKSLGKEGKLIKDPNTKLLTVTYKSGDSCDGNSFYTTTLVLRCKLGDLDSPPKLMSTSGCTYKFEWYTSAACAEDTTVGTDCMVENKKLGYEFNLKPLSKTTGEAYKVVDSLKNWTFYINVCASVLPISHCKNSHVAGVCQETSTGTFITGKYSDSLVYHSGILKLKYTDGDPYRGGNPPTLRSTEILFLCAPDKGNGQPEFVEEYKNTYIFKWYTKYACPSVPVECSVQNDATGEEYDLSSLSQSSNNWLATNTDEHIPTTKYEYFISICGSLQTGADSPAVSCKSHTSVCEVKYTANQESVEMPDLGHAKSGPKIVAKDHLVLEYVDGDVCKNNATKKYRSEVHLHCKKGALTTNPEFMGIDDNGCLYKFTWMTEKACNIKEDTVNTSSSSCSIYDANLGYNFNLKPLMKKTAPYYSIATPDGSRKFTLNICGAISTCGNHKGETMPTACMNGNTTLGLQSKEKLQYSEDGDLVLSYDGDTVGSSKYSVEIQFVCNQLIPIGAPKYISMVNNKYQFEFQTSIACGPTPVDCLITDSKGNEYDLNPLARSDKNWDFEDTHNIDTKYFINVCKPLVRTHEVTCPEGTIGGCQVTKTNSYITGYIQSKPTVAEDGTITIQYHNGDLCHKGTPTESHRSTLIIFTCFPTEQGPEFREETPECQYVIDWKTPSACPVKQSTGTECKVTEPNYGQVFDLSTLKLLKTSNYNISAKTADGTQYYFIMNICGNINDDFTASECAKDKGVGSCQTDENSLIKNAGLSSTALSYKDGEITLQYDHGSICHQKYNRATVITFKCDHMTTGIPQGPQYIGETDDCIYNFEMYTHLACYKIPPVPDCRLVTTDGTEYDLGSLILTNDSYEITGPVGSKKMFYINICGTVVNKKGLTCPPGSGACMVSTDTDGKRQYSNVGSVSSHVLEKEGNALVIKYTDGKKCSDQTKNSSTVILFVCADGQTVESPPRHLYTEGDCVYHFTWNTKAACPVKSSDGGNCTATNPETGHIFNMKALASKDGKGYKISSEDTLHDYILDICKAPSPSPCGKDIGVCQTAANDESQSWNAGKYNSRLHFIDGYIYLNYTDGQSCHDGKFTRNTIIRFICGHNDESKPVFITESDDCTYYINWHTELACENKVPCFVSDPKDNYEIRDLTPLIKTTGYYTAISALENGGSATYYLNPCEALNSIPGKLCPPGASACKEEEGKQPVSLGRPAGPPTLDENGHVILSYVNGSPCPDNTNLRIKSKIVFSCQSVINMGIPELFSYIKDTCEYVFNWATNTICTDSEEKVADCKYFDNKTGSFLDFSKLKSSSGYEVPNAKKGTGKYSLNVCGEAQNCNSGDSVCLQKGDEIVHSYGTVSPKVDFIPEGEYLKMKVTSTEPCGSGSDLYAAYIRFKCDRDMKDNGKPTLLTDDSECITVFDWKTPVACPPVVNPCILGYGDKTFDLRMLSRPEDSWIVANKDGDIFHINLCQAVHGLPGCSPNAAICRTTKNFAEVQTLGTLDHQSLKYVGGQVVVKYLGGTTDACSSKKEAQVEMYLKCGKTLGKPKFIVLHEEECIFEFQWDTHVACQEERVPVELVDGALLIEPISQTQISLQKIHNNVSFYGFQENGISYRFSLFGKDCEEAGTNSVVCETKPNCRSLGDKTEAKYYFEGSLLEAEYKTETPCERNAKKKVRTFVEFQCSASSYHLKNGPELHYITADCEYIFEWYTPELCFNVPDPDNNFQTKPKHTNTTAVVLGVITVVVLVCVIAIIFHNPARRKRFSLSVRRLFRRSDNGSAFQYSRLSNNDNNESQAGLLRNQDTGYGTGGGGLPTFHDDSDDDILL